MPLAELRNVSRVPYPIAPSTNFPDSHEVSRREVFANCVPVKDYFLSMGVANGRTKEFGLTRVPDGRGNIQRRILALLEDIEGDTPQQKMEHLVNEATKKTHTIDEVDPDVLKERISCIVQIINTWCWEVLMTDEDKTSGKLEGQVFRELDLKDNRDFSKAKLRGVHIYNSNLSDFNFSGADLTGAVFENCNIIGANFTDANLTRAVGTKCDLNLADLAKPPREIMVGGAGRREDAPGGEGGDEEKDVW
jgi:hypothetical protein